MVKVNEKELKEIFNEIKNYNNSAFEKLYNKYNTLVYGIAFSILKNKQDAEDVVQTVFAKIYDIDTDKLPTQKEASWLYTITKNESITLLRKRDNIFKNISKFII
ncbi:MAG: sigma-70 family RNA polymerase sigma factor [Clostridia bacterium]|nr:sigma-70 family RNA polymerase sigma factor [Clostridia bacterium]